jgi:hypothetical protein
VREQLELRLKELTVELETGQQMLAELDAKRLDLQQTLLRIGGAVQVLGELLAADSGAAQPADSTSP